MITWSTGCTDTVLLHYLKRGANRDVFAVEQWALVLKIQKVVYHVSSNAREAALAHGALRCCTVHVYGCVQCEWQGDELSVLVLELVAQDFDTFFGEITQRQADEEGVKAVLAVISSFFALVHTAAWELKYCLVDLQWSNLGVTSHGVLVLVDLESFEHAPALVSYKRWLRGVTVWLKNLEGCAGNLPDCSSWQAPMRKIIESVERWWRENCHEGPFDHAINEMLATSRWAALEAIPEVWLALRRQWQTDAREVMQLRTRGPQELTSLVESFL